MRRHLDVMGLCTAVERGVDAHRDRPDSPHSHCLLCSAVRGREVIDLHCMYHP